MQYLRLSNVTTSSYTTTMLSKTSKLKIYPNVYNLDIPSSITLLLRRYIGRGLNQQYVCGRTGDRCISLRAVFQQMGCSWSFAGEPQCRQYNFEKLTLVLNLVRSLFYFFHTATAYYYLSHIFYDIVTVHYLSHIFMTLLQYITYHTFL